MSKSQLMYLSVMSYGGPDPQQTSKYDCEQVVPIQFGRTEETNQKLKANIDR